MTITQSADLITNHPVIGQVEFGIGGGKVPQTAHVAYFWETEGEFADGVRFLEAGLRGLDHCVISVTKKPIKRYAIFSRIMVLTSGIF